MIWGAFDFPTPPRCTVMATYMNGPYAWRTLRLFGWNNDVLNDVESHILVDCVGNTIAPSSWCSVLGLSSIHTYPAFSAMRIQRPLPWLCAGLAISLICFTRPSLSADIVGKLTPNEHLWDPTQLEIDTRVVLNYGAKGSAYVLKDGSFKIQGVDPGDYLMTIYSRKFLFPFYYVHVPSSDPSSVQIVLHNPSFEPPTLPLHSSLVLPNPLPFKAVASAKYTEEPKKFNLVGMLMGNPMMLLMVGGGALVFMLPKIMSTLDPDALKEMQANQADMQRNMASMQNMDFTSGLSKFLSGAEEPDTNPVAPSSSSSGRRPPGGGGGPKRRR